MQPKAVVERPLTEKGSTIVYHGSGTDLYFSRGLEHADGVWPRGPGGSEHADGACRGAKGARSMPTMYAEVSSDESLDSVAILSARVETRASTGV